jgi:hypothetical protein
MRIIFVFLLCTNFNDLLCKPLKSNEKFRSNSKLEDTEKRYLWTIRQLKRCYVWSKTLPPEEQLDYLITLLRKVYISTLLDKIATNIKK